MTYEDVLPTDDVLRQRVERLLRWADDNDPEAEGVAVAQQEAQRRRETSLKYHSVLPFSSGDYIDGFQMCMCHIHDILYGRE